jgi:hypothetical protein
MFFFQNNRLVFSFKMSNLQGTQEQYVDFCNIPLPPKQKYASFDAPVSLESSQRGKSGLFIRK